ncbi:MAG: stage V sporulation protein AE [Oscillospiraceae bacterium]|nr:stage V sporulation protein AE [Oscillospiraceae bacterium]
MEYLKAFFVGGIICFLGQLLIDRTKLTPARILIGMVVAGVILGALGIYDRILRFAGAGASVPIIGFGSLLARGVKTAVNTRGFLGIFTGGLGATAGGVAAAVFFAQLISLIFDPKDK